MQNEAQKTPTSPAFGRSSIKRLPAELREAVDQAIADGATIDEITARIRAEGETCSRSAVGRYAKTMRDLIREQQETDRTIQAWVQALGERPEGQSGLILIETLRTMALATMAHLSAREEPVSTGGACPPRPHPSSASRAPTSSGRTVSRRRRRPRAPAGPKRRGGLSPETVAIIPRGGGGEAAPRRRRRPAPHRHVGAGGPVGSCGIPAIQLNPRFFTRVMVCAALSGPQSRKAAKRIARSTRAGAHDVGHRARGVTHVAGRTAPPFGPRPGATQAVTLVRHADSSHLIPVIPALKSIRPRLNRLLTPPIPVHLPSRRAERGRGVVGRCSSTRRETTSARP